MVTLAVIGLTGLSFGYPILAITNYTSRTHYTLGETGRRSSPNHMNSRGFSQILVKLI